MRLHHAEHRPLNPFSVRFADTCEIFLLTFATEVWRFCRRAFLTRRSRRQPFSENVTGGIKGLTMYIFNKLRRTFNKRNKQFTRKYIFDPIQSKFRLNKIMNELDIIICELDLINLKDLYNNFYKRM